MPTDTSGVVACPTAINLKRKHKLKYFAAAAQGTKCFLSLWSAGTAADSMCYHNGVDRVPI